MKAFNFLSSLFIVFIIVLYILSCSEKKEPQKAEGNFVSYQIPGCNKHTLSITADTDSCFSYNFDTTLKIDFCVTGNCCPDKNRFASSYKINSDTIFVTVKDIEENNCLCMCNYTIHLELKNLENDNYAFYCNYNNLKYRELVKK